MQNDTLKKGLKEYRHPSLSWLYRMYATLRSVFQKNLPELEEFSEETSKDPVFRVVAWTVEAGRVKVLGHIESFDPKDVDFLIADMGTRIPGATLTLMGPGVALRLNRKARRAAMSRVKRWFRRDARALKAQRRALVRYDKNDDDRDRRDRLSESITLRRSAFSAKFWGRCPGPSLMATPEARRVSAFAAKVWGQDIDPSLMTTLEAHSKDSDR